MTIFERPLSLFSPPSSRSTNLLCKHAILETTDVIKLHNEDYALCSLFLIPVDMDNIRFCTNYLSLSIFPYSTFI